MRKLIYICLFLLLSFSVLTAQESEWTLSECIKYALDHNIGVKRQELTTELAKKDFTQSKLNALPDLNGVVEHQLGSGRVLDRGTYEWYNTNVSQGDMGIQSTLTLFDGLQGVNRIQRDKALYDMNVANLEAYRDDIMLNIMTAYLELLRTTELSDIAEKKLEVVALQVGRMQRMVELGTQSPGELLTIKSQYSNEKLNLTRAKNAMNTARLDLMQLMNISVSDTFDITHPDMRTPEEMFILGVDSIYGSALEQLPQIRSAEYYVKAQKKDLAVSQGMRSPTLYVRGLYYTNYSNKLTNPLDGSYDYPLPQQLIDNQYRQLTLGVSVPIFNKWQTQTQISKARISYQDADYYLENQKQTLMKSIQQYYALALGARDEYFSALELVASSSEAYDAAGEKFRVGLVSAVELEEARNKLFESKSQMVTSRYFYIFYCKILDYYRGEDVVL